MDCICIDYHLSERSRYAYSKQIGLSDGITIEADICRGESFKQIVKGFNRHPFTIAHEVKENRTFIKDTYPCEKDCKFVRKYRGKF